MLLLRAPGWAQLQGESLCQPQLCLVGIPGGGYNAHTTEGLGGSPGSLAAPGGSEKALEGQGRFARGLSFLGGRVFSTEGRSRTKAGRQGRVWCL